MRDGRPNPDIWGKIITCGEIAVGILFRSVPMVSGCRPPPGRGTLCRADGAQPGVALPGMRDAVFSQTAQLPILSRLCRETQTPEQKAVGEKTQGACIEKRRDKALTIGPCPLQFN